MARQSKNFDPSEDGVLDSMQNRRRNQRFTSDVKNVSLTVHADVTDESLKGIGLVLEPGWEPELGIRVEVQYRGAPMWGVVRATERLPDGGCRVGLEWVG